MRVAFVITSMPVGGAETLLVNLIRGMDKSRFSPEIVCLKDEVRSVKSYPAKFPLLIRSSGVSTIFEYFRNWFIIFESNMSMPSSPSEPGIKCFGDDWPLS